MISCSQSFLVWFGVFVARWPFADGSFILPGTSRLVSTRRINPRSEVMEGINGERTD
jgi:hypothetical protein